MSLFGKTPPTAGPAGHADLLERKGAPRAVDWIERNAMLYPDHTAQVDLASGRRFTYAQMNDRVGRAAALLEARGVGPGDRVGFLAMNSTDILEMVFATWRLGAVSLALNFRLTAKELAFIIKDAGPDIILVDQAFLDIVDALQSETPVRQWLLTDGLGGDTAYERGLASVDRPLLTKTFDQTLSDQCMLMYSSGTTGLPKGVIITHEMMVFSAVNLMGGLCLTRKSVNFAVMPLFHIGGLNIFSCPVLYAGGTTLIQRAFEPGEALRVFNDRDLGVTHFLGVPAIYNALKAHPDNAATDFSGVEVMLAGAEAVPNALVEWWHQRGLTIQEGYGMTESAASNCVLDKADVQTRIGSAGKAAMHTEMKIVREDGTDAAPGDLGEIWMRGPAITPGYWNRPDANEKSFSQGWFRSGDIGRVDEAGYFYIEDRLKDMYISGGENVYPAEVENVLYGLDEVAEVAVIGVPDTRWGEVGCAVVALKPGKTLQLSDISAFVSDKLASFKHPRHIAFVEALPRNATGKVLKFELRKSIPETLNLL